MKNVGVVGLLCCTIISLSAMQETQNLRDMAASHGLSSEQKQKKSAEKELQSCAICYDDMALQDDTIHTQCTSELHVFHKQCLTKWYATDQPNHKKCPTCRTTFSSATKKILERERKKMRVAEEAAHPELRQERERLRFWAKFAHFTAVGLAIASVATAPLVLKEYIAGPGAGRPIFAEAAQIILPTTVTLAIPLEGHARRLLEQEEAD